jgi:hypothetical protein
VYCGHPFVREILQQTRIQGRGFKGLRVCGSRRGKDGRNFQSRRDFNFNNIVLILLSKSGKRSSGRREIGNW